MLTVEIGDYRGHVVMLISNDQDHVEIVMSADEARELCNNIGSAIQCAAASRTGALT